MVRRSAPLLLLVWLLLLALAGAFSMFLHGAPPTEFGPSPRELIEGEVDDPNGTRTEATERWTLTGRVEDERRYALPGAHVESRGVRVDTGEDGRFELGGLPGEDREITVWKEGWTLVTRSVAPGDAIVIRLVELVDVEGTVLRPDGLPAAGVAVTFRGRGETSREATTDDAGRFVFQRVPAGRSSVHAAPLVDESGGYQRSAAELVAGDGESVVVTLHEGMAIRGVVRDPAGNLVEGAECHVSAYREGHTWEPHRVTTGADGTFALTGIPRGRNSVIVETPTPERGFRYLRWFQHHMQPIEGELDVRLEEGQPIAGHLVTPRGIDFTGRRIWACRIAGRTPTAITCGTVQEDGTFHIGGLWDAWYELRLEGASTSHDRYLLDDGYRVQSGTMDVELRVAVTRNVGGTVRNGDGDAVARRGVLIQNPDIGLTRRVVTDESGRFDADRIPPGDVSVFVLRAGRNNGAFDCGSWPAGDVNIDIRIHE